MLKKLRPTEPHYSCIAALRNVVINGPFIVIKKVDPKAQTQRSLKHSQPPLFPVPVSTPAFPCARFNPSWTFPEYRQSSCAARKAVGYPRCISGSRRRYSSLHAALLRQGRQRRASGGARNYSDQPCHSPSPPLPSLSLARPDSPQLAALTYNRHAVDERHRQQRPSALSRLASRVARPPW